MILIIRQYSSVCNSICSSCSYMFRFNVFSLLFFIIVSSLMMTDASLNLPPGETVPAVIVFGDSIVDSGNNNYIKTLIKSNFLPYGVDFNGGVPTGRFSNGKIPSDFLAEELGVKEIIPAYLDPDLKPEDLLTGVTFASGGSGYDPLTPELLAVISLSDQLKYFEEYIEKLKKMVGEERTNFILGNSLFMVVAGSDDIANTYFGLSTRRLQYDVASYTTFIATSASDFINKLYGYGARRIGVLGVPPIGCLPSQRTLAGGLLLRNCAENHNEAAKLFNSKLSQILNSLTGTLPGSRLVYLDLYTPLFDMIQYPKKYGFEVVDKGCCGTGNIEVAVLCNRYTSTTCSNVSSYIFWDSYHPTERACKLIISQLVQKYASMFFFQL